jgi:hypothetical protein
MNSDIEFELEILMKNLSEDFPAAAEKLLANLGLKHLIQFNQLKQKRGEKE